MEKQGNNIIVQAALQADREYRTDDFSRRKSEKTYL